MDTKPVTQPRKRRLTELLDPAFMARLDGLDVVSRKILQGKLQGERRSKRRGQSVEFADHRPYVAGDDLRFVDWNIYGRLDQLFLKLFLEELDLTVHVVLDLTASMSMGDPAKDRYAKQLAAALSYIGLVNNNRVTVSILGEGIRHQLASMRGRNYIPALADLLQTVDAEGASDFDKSCRQLVETRTGRGLMILLSDFMFKEGYESGLRRLVGRNYELYLLQILSPQEIKPDLSGDLKLVDVEDADVAEITVSRALLTYYEKTLNTYCRDLQTFCTQRQAQYVLASTANPVEGLVLNTLRKLRLLH